MRRFATRAALAARAIAIVLLAGCAADSLQPEAPDVKTYVLDAEIAPRSPERPAGGVLVVDTPRAQPGFDTELMAYTRAEHAVDYYTKSQWADEPARMIGPLVVRAMEASGAFRAVVSDASQAEGDLRLELDIIRLQQEFLQQPSRVRLTVRAKLFDERSRHVLATRLFEAVEPAGSEDAYGGVRAANRAAERVLGELVDFVLDSLRGGTA